MADSELDQVDVDGEPPEFDLTPRTGDGSGGRARKPRRWAALLVLVVITGVVVLVLSQALGSASEYFYRVDEAVAHRADLGTRRFRMEGTVAGVPARTGSGDQQEAVFHLSANGAKVRVEYQGSEPPALFKPCEPVVIVGRWQGDVFHGDQIIVKHTEKYSAEHPERLDPTCA